jgi:hypothetical protein
MGKYYPEYAEFMEMVNGRVYDLMMIFKKKLFVDAKFCGSASIKIVLPVLVPELSYKELAIHEGGTASASWPRLIDSTTPPVERKKLKNDMLVYCGRDTMAMVRILEEVEKEIK